MTQSLALPSTLCPRLSPLMWHHATGHSQAAVSSPSADLGLRANRPHTVSPWASLRGCSQPSLKMQEEAWEQEAGMPTHSSLRAPKSPLPSCRTVLVSVRWPLWGFLKAPNHCPVLPTRRSPCGRPPRAPHCIREADTQGGNMRGCGAGQASGTASLGCSGGGTW